MLQGGVLRRRKVGCYPEQSSKGAVCSQDWWCGFAGSLLFPNHVTGRELRASYLVSCTNLCI